MLEITDIPVDGYEEVKQAVDPDRGLHAIVAVHSTVLGPALGGMRLWPYPSRADALTDVLRLAKGMTYKAACAGLDLGGGKSVLIGSPASKTPELFEAMGDFVETFAGRYITAEDVNTKVEDMEYVRSRTQYVTGLQTGSGNPSPKTAYGCFLGLQATLEEVHGDAGMKDKVFAIEGPGSVGKHYARMIAEHGGKIVCADINDAAARACAAETGGTIVGPDEIRSIECDVYAPCALGNTINDETIPRFKCRAIVGAANNQLGEQRHGDMLRERGIKYAPDYVVNAGGLINVYNELAPGGYDEVKAMAMMVKIYDNLKKIFALATEYDISTAVAADRFGEARVRAALENAPQSA